ncbi:MAG: hypothetical protein HZB54_01160 [Deltaproteobacteria bacterium]|nr:hypothetical protein [Deltaproteobacteria bacterium]
MTKEFVITGIGIVSAAGIGKDEFWDAAINGKSGIKEISHFDTSRYKSHLGGEIRDFDLDAIFSDRRFRRVANISKYSLASSKLAVDDAGLDSNKWDGIKVGLVVGVTHGAINYTREFHAAMVKDGPAAVSPMLFSDSVLNAPAGNVSIAFNIKGAAHTIIGGMPTGLDAIAYAIKIMQSNNLDMCIAGGTEEIDSIVFDSYARLRLLSPNSGKPEGIKPFGIDRNGFVVGEGACMLVLEEKKAAIERMARIYAGIHSVDTALHINPAQSNKTFRDIDTEATYIAAGANGTSKDNIEAKVLQAVSAKRPFIGNIKPITGECFAAGSAMQTALAAMVIHKGIIPPSRVGYDLIPEIDWARFNPYAENAEVETAMVSSIGLEGEGSFLVLKKVN